jgi:small subunit ribosomal protein S21
MKEYKDLTQEDFGVCVVAKDGESFESLERRFKKKVNKSGIEKDMLLRMFYEKPSIRKRRKRAEARRRLRREQLKYEKFLKKIEKKKGRGYIKDEDKSY